MKKTLLLLIGLSFCLTLICSAHAGRTDENGGHYDRGSGEYHYHHGYPAHQHTDGKCPYDFDDRTGEDSGSPSSGSSTGSGSASSSSIGNGSKKFFPSYNLIFDIVRCVPILLFVGWIITVYFKQIRIAISNKRKRDEELRQFSAKMQAERKELIAKYSGKTKSEIATLCGMPTDFFLDENNLPHSIPNQKDSDKCTVYIASTGSVYHRNPRCCQRFLSPINIAKVRHLNTCRYCAPDRIDLHWYDRYKETLSLLKRHGIEPVSETTLAQLPPCNAPVVDE